MAVRFAQRGLRVIYGTVLCSACATAHAMLPLNDTALSSVRGQDGLSFDLSGFAVSGDARFTYYAPDSTASLYVANVEASRSDDAANAFSDPYHLEVVRGAAGMADVIRLSFPANTAGLKRWQSAFDWGTDADGLAFEGGSVVIRDAVFRGGGMEWTTPRAGEGIAFGIGLRLDIGNVLLRPRGRGDTTAADAAGSAEQLNVRRLRLGAVDSGGNFLDAPWRIADVATQPGVLNAVSDSAGRPRLHFGIGWPGAEGAGRGGLQIDNISFRSDVSGNLDLGASRIGSMQIQYLDVKVRP